MLRQAHNSPKLKRLKARLGIPQYQATGILTELWHMTATQAIRGDIGKWSNFDIAASLEWEGDPDDLVNALVECGWVDEHVDHTIRLVIHDWHQHSDGNVKAAVKKRGGFITSESPARLDEAVTPEPAPARKKTAGVVAESDIAFTIPLQRDETGFITKADAAGWVKAYPDINVEDELRRIWEWNQSNPSKRKTARGLRKHVTAWLNRAQGEAVEVKAKGRGRGRSTASMGADEFGTKPQEKKPGDPDPVEQYRRENQAMMERRGSSDRSM